MALSGVKVTSEANFTGRALLTIALILGVIGMQSQSLSHYLLHSHERIARLLGSMKFDTVNNREDIDALVAGYYEQLDSQTTGVVGLPRVIGKGEIQFRNDFLRFELKPNIHDTYKAGLRFTNSMGMANPEYSYEKPPHTRRIAILGDSISLGPYGHDYVALLEGRLNHNCTGPDIQNYQVLNFSVYAYSILQFMDVGLNKASYFHPDVDVVAMTSLEFFPENGWAVHIANLRTSGIDLKYDYLRQVVAQAGIQPGSHFPAIRKKLEPYKLQVIRWALEQIRDHDAAQGAKTIVILVPAPINPDFTSDDFNQLHEAADPVGVPIIDMRDTFRSVNLESIMVDPHGDMHPNVAGHALIADSLFTKLQAQPDALLALTGHPCQIALPSPATGN